MRLALHFVCGIDKTVQELRNDLHDEVKKMVAENSNATKGKPWDGRVLGKIQKYRLGECKLEDIKVLKCWINVAALEIAFLVTPIVKDINFVIYGDGDKKMLHEMFRMFRRNAKSIVAFRSDDHYDMYVPQHLEQKCETFLRANKIRQPGAQTAVSRPNLIISTKKVNTSCTNAQKQSQKYVIPFVFKSKTLCTQFPIKFIGNQATTLEVNSTRSVAR